MRSRGRKNKNAGGTGIIQLPAIAYGAMRNPAATLILPITHGVTGMLGEYEDEAVMLGASWALAKYGSGFLSEMGRKGLVVENASIGATLSRGISLGGASATTNSMSRFEY